VTVAQPPDLTGLRVRRVDVFNLLQVSVHSSAPTTKPQVGAYVLELLKERASGTELLARARLHEIGTRPTFNGFVRSGPDAEGRSTYSITRTESLGPTERVLVRLTDPNGLQSELRGGL
jgi:hypothetical protein